jgi:hypothetical protein
MTFDVLSEINYLAVVVAALAYFAWGAIWYAPRVMGNRWQKAVGLTQEQLRPNPMVFVGTYIAYLLMAVTLAAIARSIPGATDFADGLVLGLFVGIGIVTAGIWVGGMYEQRMNLAWLNIVNGLIGTIIMAVIVTIWD